MSERNILALAYYFPPFGVSGALRTVKFIKYLCDYGWSATVLAGAPKSNYAYDESLLEDFDERNVEIMRVTSKELPKISESAASNDSSARSGANILSSLLYQPDAKIRWKKNALRLADEIMRKKKIHCIFASAPPFSNFIIAKEISEKYKIPYVADYRESWLENRSRSFPTPMHRSWNAGMENDVLKTAAKVIVSHRLAKERLLLRYRFMRHEDISIIPSGYDAEDFLPFIAFRPEPGKFTITHCGMFDQGSSPLFFLKALSKLKKRMPQIENFFEARFIGTLRQSDLKAIKKLELEKIVWATGYVPHQEAVGLMAESNALWLTDKSEVDAPGKVFEYFGVRRPILCLAPENSATRKVAAEIKAVFYARPNSVKEISAELERIVELWQSGHFPQIDDSVVRGLNYYDLTADLSRELAIAAKL